MTNREKHFKQINHFLSVFRFSTSQLAKQGMYDQHVVAESFFRDFLNILFGLKLVGTNFDGPNAPAIDLADREKRICFQITGENSTKKVQKSLDMFAKHKLFNEFDRLRVLILTTKQGTYTIKPDPRVGFDQAKDILDIDDVLTEVKNADAKKLAALADLVAGEDPPVVSDPIAGMSDFDVLTVYRQYFDRDALRHEWRVEGSMQGFESALTDMMSLIQAGRVGGRQIAKSRVHLQNAAVAQGLDKVYVAVSDLRALYGRHIRTGEIRPEHNFYCFNDRGVPAEFDKHKQAVVDAMNAVLRTLELPLLRGVRGYH